MFDRGVLPGPAGLRLDGARRLVSIDGRAVTLTRREFDLLSVLLEDRGRAIGFDELARRAWGHITAGDRRFIQTAAWRLRRSLTSAGAGDVIENVRGFGYRIPEEDGAPSIAPWLPTERAVALFDPSHPLLAMSRVNEAATELSARAVDELTRPDGLDIPLWSPDERVVIDQTVRLALESGTALTRGRSLTRATGEIVLVDVRYTRLDLAGETPLCLAEVVPSGR